MATARDAAVAAGRGPVLVCLLTLPGGTRYAFGTEALTLTQRGIDTAPIQVIAGLVADEAEVAIDPFALSGETALTQAQVSVVLPDSAVAMQGDFRYVGAARAELARVWPGDDWQDRETLIAGTQLSGVTLGRAGEPSTFTIEAAPAKTSALIGDAGRLIGDDFPAPVAVSGADLTRLDGVEYPQVHGAPYRSAGFKIGEIGGDGYDRVVIAGHKFYDTTAIEAFADGVSLGTFTVHNGTASSGDYAYIRSGTATVFDEAAGAITVAPVYGGIVAYGHPRAASNLGDVLELWLAASELPVAWERCLPAIQRLRNWPGGVYLDRATAALSAIRDHLAQSLPLVELQSPEGLWFYLADLDTFARRGTLTEGQELIGPVGGVALTEIEDIYNAVTVRYAMDEASGEFTGSVTVDADTDAVCYVSTGLYGVRPADTIETVAVGDATTARRVGRAAMHRAAYQRRRMEWVIADTADVTVGEVYRVVSPTFSIDADAVLTSLVGGVSRSASFVVLDGPL